MNDLWKHLVCMKWPHVNKDLAVPDWRRFYRLRQKKIKQSSWRPQELLPIDNCAREDCPAIWQSLTRITMDDCSRRCYKCTRSVNICDIEDIPQQISKGRRIVCVDKAKYLKNRTRNVKFVVVPPLMSHAAIVVLH